MIRTRVCASAVALAFSLAAAAQEAPVDDYDVIYAPAMIAPEATSAVLTEIATTAEREVAVGDYGVVITREQGSETWQQAAVPTSVFLTSVDFANDTIGWAAGHHGVILRTIDGGQTWQRQLDGFDYIELQLSYYKQRVAELEAELASADLVPEREAELEFLLDDALFRLDNANFAKEEGPTKPFLDVLALSENEVLVSGAYGALLYTDDAGESWQILDDRVENPDAFHLNAIQNLGDFVFLAGESGLLFRSDDRGATWETLESPYYGSFFGMYVDQLERLWVYGLRGNIFMSEDKGDSFTQLKLEDPVNINAAIDAPDNGLYFVGNAGVVAYLSENGKLVEHTHDSGAALTDLVIDGNGDLTFVGQRGVLSMPSRALTEKE
ncbi:WD40/YVTN/BNR-like repeat-containing protein [Pseudidiomarina sp. E22-M8]|uniref:WD40/YVTN/BNR-like repeat-containing protein n=1 Tax=Pseudidiomarina sp. E22-M8 TaxID=3424768 RepID=UPI00403CDF50